MSTIDNTGTAHETRIYSFEDTNAPHGITTWWAWECTCGAGNEGIDEVFAADLARTHEARMTACVCGTPIITFDTNRDAFTTPWVEYTITCACGYREPVRMEYFANGRIGNSQQTRESAHRTALHRYGLHKCHALAGHGHTHTAPTAA